jgi:hypothetical protein
LQNWGKKLCALIIPCPKTRTWGTLGLAGAGERQEQLQILRLRCAPLRMTRLRWYRLAAQDDSLSGSGGRVKWIVKTALGLTFENFKVFAHVLAELADIPLVSATALEDL